MGVTNGYKLNPYDSLFIESTGAAGVWVVRDGGSSASVGIVGS